MGKVEIEIAHVGDLLRVFDRALVLSEKRLHFFRAFHIELIRFKAEGTSVRDFIVRLDAHEHRLRIRVGAAQIMRVVGSHERDAGLTGKAQKSRVHFLLLLNSVILELEIVAVLAEQLPHRKRMLLRLVVVACGEHTGDIARKTGGKADKTLAVLREKLEVDPRLCVKALRKSL